MPSRRRTRISKTSKQLAHNAFMKGTVTANTTLGFFKFPQEIRDHVYKFLWEDRKVIGVVQRHSKIGIDAHFDDNDDEEDAISASVHAPHNSRHSYSDMGTRRLPAWLLLNKLFLREAMARFNAHSTWVLRRMNHAGAYAPLPRATIMIPGLAKALSLARISFQRPLSEVTMRRHRTRQVTIKFSDADANWIENLAAYLHQQNQVQKLAISLQYPFVDFKLEGTHKIKIDLRPVQGLLRVPEQLRCFEVELLKAPEHAYYKKHSTVFKEEVFDQVVDTVVSVWGEYDVEEEAGRYKDTWRPWKGVAMAPIYYVSTRKFVFTRVEVDDGVVDEGADGGNQGERSPTV